MKSAVHNLYTQFEKMDNCQFNNTMNRQSFSIAFDNGYAVHIMDNTQDDLKLSLYSENESYDYVLIDSINVHHNDIELVPLLIQMIEFAKKNEVQTYGMTAVAERMSNEMDKIIPEQNISDLELCR